jgi:hypothetical protein
VNKKLGIIITVICAIITATSIVGIVVANQGRVESIDPDQLQELYTISDMAFPEAPADGTTAEVSHPKSDSFVQLVKKKTDNTLTGRLRVLEGLTKKYEAMEADLVKEGMKLDSPEMLERMKVDFVEDVISYGIYRDVTNLTAWEKFCLFAVTWRSVMLIFGFLGMGLGLAIASSGSAKSDLD